MTEAAPRRRLLESGAGTRLEAFGPTEWGLLAAIAGMWGSSFLFIDVALAAFDPGVIAMGRVLLGAIALGLISSGLGPRARRAIAREDLPRVAVLGVLWLGIPMFLFPVAQQWVDSALAGMINGAMPLTTAAWSTLLLRRVPRRIHLAGLGVGFAGVVAICWPGFAGSRATALGTGLLVLAVVLYGLSACIAVPLQQRYGALPVLLRAQFAALIVVVPFGLAGLPASRWEWGPALAMLPLGVLSTAVAPVLMVTLVGRVGGPRGAVAIYFVPIVAILLGVLVLGEHIPPAAILGTALVVFGATLTSRRETPSPPACRALVHGVSCSGARCERRRRQPR